MTAPRVTAGNAGLSPELRPNEICSMVQFSQAKIHTTSGFQPTHQFQCQGLQLAAIAFEEELERIGTRLMTVRKQ